MTGESESTGPEPARPWFEPAPEPAAEPTAGPSAVGASDSGEPAFVDSAPVTPDSGVHPVLDGVPEVGFADHADGSQAPDVPSEPTTGAASAPPSSLSRAPGTSAHALGTLGRIAMPSAPAAPVASAPCPHCQKPVPLEHARCSFCGKALVKKEASPFDDTATSPGSPLALRTPAERIENASYVPEQLQQELAARTDRLAEERAALDGAARTKRRWVVRWAALLLSVPWLVVWVLALGWTWSAVLLFGVDAVAAWAIARWSISRGGGSTPTVLATSLWVTIQLLAASAKLGIFFMALGLIPGLFTLSAAALVGISIELEADELRRG